MDPCPRRPMLFHPALDTVYFHRRESDPLMFMQRAEYITSNSLTGISKIQSLKIAKVSFGGRMQGWVKFGQPRRSLYGHGGYLEPDRGGLRFFHNLKELILVARTRMPTNLNCIIDQLPPLVAEEVVLPLNTERRIEEYQESFQGFFSWEREHSPKCEIPEIVVRQERNRRDDRWYLGRLSECLEYI